MNVPISFVDSEERLWDDDTPRDDRGSPIRMDLAPGTSAWVPGMDGRCAALCFVCPCGCGNVGAITVKRTGVAEKGWEWNGDEARPTLTPSILKTSPCAWHGYLTNGEFVSV